SRDSTIFFSNSAASCGVRNSLPASSAGRSSGVTVRKSQIPCKSGWPSGVRGTADWPYIVLDAAHRIAVAVTKAATDPRTRPLIRNLLCEHLLLNSGPQSTEIYEFQDGRTDGECQ